VTRIVVFALALASGCTLTFDREALAPDDPCVVFEPPACDGDPTGFGQPRLALRKTNGSYELGGPAVLWENGTAQLWVHFTHGHSRYYLNWVELDPSALQHESALMDPPSGTNLFFGRPGFEHLNYTGEIVIDPAFSVDGQHALIAAREALTDPLHLYYSRRRPDGWGRTERLASLESFTEGQSGPQAARNGCELFFDAGPRATEAHDLYVASGRWGAWDSPVRLPASDDVAADHAPSPTVDGRHVYFTSNRMEPDGTTDFDIYVVSRREDGTWGVPLPVNGVNTDDAREIDPFVTPDGCHLFFTRGSSDVWVAARQP
jgi:hypothetical protein